MDASKLTPAQRHKLLMSLADRRDWLAKVRERMDAQAWRKEDPFYVTVCAAREAVHVALRALFDAEPKEPERDPEPKRWMQRGDGLPIVPPNPNAKPWVWVGKRKARRR
jgi:hypothetical protein